MSDYDDTNKAALFVNNRKTTDKHPDMTGTVNINGVEHWLSGWWKKPKSGGDEFLSISIGEPKEQQHAAPARPAAPARGRGRPQSQLQDDDALPPF
jgi:uncharacterized protein (DUF736 family)